MAGRRNKSYPIVIRDLEVIDAYDVTPLMRRVVVGGDQLGHFVNNGHRVEPFRTENADDHVKLVVLGPDDSIEVPAQLDGHLDWSREALDRARDYTPRRFDPVGHRLELDFVRHAGGVASEWAVRAQPGDRALVAGPRGTTVLPDDIDWFFLVGDETALPAIARRIEELPAGTPVTAVVSVPSAAEEQTFEHSTDLTITWVHRDVAGPNAPMGAGLMEAVTAARWRDGTVYAWAAGEAGMLRPLRRWLKGDRAVPPTHIDIAGYWRSGQSQSDAAHLRQRVQALTSLAVPYAVRAAVTLELAEHVADGRTTIPTLAAAAGAHPVGVRKLIRMLTFHQLFELDGDSVRLGASGSVLLDEATHQALDRRSGMARLDDSWPGLLHTIRTGRSGYEEAIGESFWATMAVDRQLGESFDASLSDWSAVWSRGVAGSLELTDETVVDVGGGTGTLIGEVLQTYPQTSGTLVELPSVAERARANLAARGLSDRVGILQQSFFEPLPAGADVYLLAQVLHDWPDPEAVKILRRVADAAGDRRIALVERLAADEDHDHDVMFDLQMYATFGSGERSLDEFAALGDRAGLTVTGTTPIGEDLHLIELRATS
ncbi:siderophore-interacting protein [Nakamurella lactea]|uniref:siderophore-interacting protein n=1 Tax=Nakamurella lactea TaxID=459515 RepID=UPI000401D4C2|nr:siderophore-interacting protein [Nakamurella lactea]